jgi:TPR repeat protein
MGIYLLTRFRYGALAALATLVFWAAPSLAQAGYSQGVSAYESGRFEAAMSEFRPLVEQGHAGAEFMTGVMYFQGRGVTQNRNIAAIWFHKAAIKGHAGAQLAFGSVHIRGIGVYQDLIQAYKWLTLAADSKVPGLQQQATMLRGDAEKLMTPEEVGDATSAARRFAPTRAGLAAGN